MAVWLVAFIIHDRRDGMHRCIVARKTFVGSWVVGVVGVVLVPSILGRCLGGMVSLDVQDTLQDAHR